MIAFGFAPGSYTTFTFGADVTVGLAFTLTSPVLVTDLGLWDFNNDGLNASHVVTVWTSTGTKEAQGTIPPRHWRDSHQRLPLRLHRPRPPACR